MNEPDRYPKVKSARMIEIDEMIEAGWGSVPANLIPADFRERLPPAMYLLGYEPEEIERMGAKREEGKENKAASA